MVERQGDWADKLVILHHVSPAVIHWDILIHPHGAPQLWAWRCLIDPASWFILSDMVCSTLIRLPDHRLKYLDYVGPVSGNRGWVRPVLRHKAAVKSHTDAEIHLATRAGDSTWVWTLKHIRGDRWNLEVGRIE